MKRLFCVSLCMLGFFFAAHQSAASVAERIELLIGNDLMTFGVTSNPDDLRSFGTSVGFAYRDGWSAELHMSGLTSRYDPVTGGQRMDEAVLTAAYTLPIFQADAGIYAKTTLSTGIGLTAAGDLGFSSVQNIIHQLFHIPAFIIPYETPGTFSVYPALTLRGSSRLQTSVDEPYMFVSLSGFGTYTFDYAWTAASRLDLGWSFNPASYISVGSGLSASTSLSTSRVHDLVSHFESGLTAYLESRFGLLSLKYRWNLDKLHGYGRMGVDLGRTDMKEVHGRDVILTHSMVIPYFSLATTFRYAMSSNTGLYLRNTYFSRKAEDNIPAHQNMSAWFAGLDVEFPILPNEDAWIWYVSAGVGLSRTLLISYKKGIEHYEVVMNHFRFCNEISAGIRAFQDSKFSWKGAAYGIEAAAGLRFNHAPGTKTIAGDIPLLQMETLYPFISLGVQAYVSLD